GVGGVRSHLAEAPRRSRRSADSGRRLDQRPDRDRGWRHRLSGARLRLPPDRARHSRDGKLTVSWTYPALPPMRLESRCGDRVVLAFAERPKSVWEMVESAAARHPDGEALVCGEKRMTWREVAVRAAAIAAGLQAKGLAPGDRLAILLGNRIEFVLSMFA